MPDLRRQQTFVNAHNANLGRSLQPLPDGAGWVINNLYVYRPEEDGSEPRIMSDELASNIKRGAGRVVSHDKFLVIRYDLLDNNMLWLLDTQRAQPRDVR